MHVIQVKVPLKLTEKLIVMISLSIQMMMCGFCVAIFFNYCIHFNLGKDVFGLDICRQFGLIAFYMTNVFSDFHCWSYGQNYFLIICLHYTLSHVVCMLYR